MRWREILFESVAKYRPMFAGLIKLGGDDEIWVGAVDAKIKKIEDIFKREDRVVWALRWVRLHLFEDMDRAGYITISKQEKDKVLRKLTQGLSANNHSITELLDMAEEFDTILKSGFWEHILSLPVAHIQNYVFDKQSPDLLRAHLMGMESAWQTTRSQVLDHKKDYGIDDEDWDDPEDEDDPEERYNYLTNWGEKERRIRGKPKLLIDFGDGWAWWNLNRAYCTVEGDAMGHCGNSAEPRHGDTVLSLRKHMGGSEYRPSLTFILHKNGFLGEMKGRANNKPKAAYHDMIVALLMRPEIKGIVGGGYEANNNFSVEDLPEEVREKVLANKPMMISPMDAYKRWKEDASEENLHALQERVKVHLEAHGFPWQSHWKWTTSRYNTQCLQINEWANAAVYMKKTYYNTAELDRLDNIMQPHNMVDHMLDVESDLSETKAYEVASDIYDEYYTELFAQLLGTSVGEFALEGVFVEYDGGPIRTLVEIGNLVNPSGYGDDWMDNPGHVFDRISTLDEIYEEDKDHRPSWEDMREGFHLDEFALNVVHYCLQNDWSGKEPTEDKIAILALSLHDQSSHYYSDHPDQLSFDFKK